MLKKVIYLLMVILLSVSFFHCSLHDSVEENIPPASSEDIIVETAFPGEKGEIIKGLVNINGDVREVTYERINGKNVFQGDIILPDEDIIQGISRSIVCTARKWPYAINYSIATNVYNRSVIENAIRHWEAHTALRFFNNPTGDYIHFIPSSGSWSYVGRIGGKQELGLADWADTGTVIHEIGHAIGLEHEHCRADRDNYITIHWQNIENGNEYNFNKKDTATYHDVGTFDFNSVMLYSSYAFSKTTWYWWWSWSEPTITRKDGSTFDCNRSNLSAGDIEGINYLYPPSSPSGAYAEFYEHANYSGRRYIVARNDQVSVSELEKVGLHDEISSIKLYNGAEVVVYQHGSYGGASLYVKSNISHLSSYDMNDRISSISWNVPSGAYAVFYQHSNYGGRPYTFWGDYSNLKNRDCNDMFSSLRLYNGAAVRVYEHSYYSGSNKYFSSDVSALSSYSFNDEISSLRFYN